MKIALAQINTLMGQPSLNAKRMLKRIDQARKQGADVVVFSELTLCGYPPYDYVYAKSWRKEHDVAFRHILDQSKGLHVVFGTIVEDGNLLYNSAVWIHKDGQVHFKHKELLPNQDVFHEKRYFVPGNEPALWEINGTLLGVTVCEDIWGILQPHYHHNPLGPLYAKKPDIVINLSASPFEPNKNQIRHDLIRMHQESYGCPYVYVNSVGGNDELVFDGASFVMDASGHVVAQAKAFEEDLLIWDQDVSDARQAYPERAIEQQRDAIELGLKDFVHKCGFEKVVLGLSGGIDSAVVASLAVEVFGKDNVLAAFMPTEYTRNISEEDARAIAKNLDIELIECDIDALKNQFFETIDDAFEKPSTLMTQENIQSRLRGNVLMALSSERNALVLQTGNKSEIALGYATLYGDMVGAVSPIGDLYKSEVYALGKLLNERNQAIPQRVFDRAPSAELREDQKDEDSLPSYNVVDAVLKRLIEKQSSVEEIVRDGFDEDEVRFLVSKLANMEFKRRQAAPILRVSPKSFGIGRRMPIATRPYEG